MSIRTGKGGYSAIPTFQTRTVRELAERGEIFRRDTVLDEGEVAWVTSQITGAASVLELGSGLGPWAWVAERAGVGMYLGIEPVLERVQYAREHGPQIPTYTFAHRDARTLDVAVRFDVVLTVTVLQHLTLPDACDLLAAASRHLHVGGRLVMLESLLYAKTEEECEALYAMDGCAAHMIPKPLSVLQRAVPDFLWEVRGGDRWVLTKMRS